MWASARQKDKTMENTNPITINISVGDVHICNHPPEVLEELVEPRQEAPQQLSVDKWLASLSPEQKLMLTRMWGGLQPLQLAVLLDDRLTRTYKSVSEAAPKELLVAAQASLDKLKVTEQADMQKLHILDAISALLFVLDKRGLLGLDSLFTSPAGKEPTKQ